MARKYPDRYIITAKTVKDSPTVKVEKGERIWLYWSPEGGGWWQWSKAKDWAERFPDKNGPRFKDAIACAPDVGPWFYVPDPETIETVAVPAIVTIS